MIERLRSLAKADANKLDINGWHGYSLFISISNSKERAVTHHVMAVTFEQAWHEIQSYFNQWKDNHPDQPCWLRIDSTQSIQKTNLKQFKTWLKKVKRNYFRYGLLIGDQAQYAFTEQELNANAMLYGGVKRPHVIINEKNFSIYARKKYKEFQFDFDDAADVFMLDNKGVFTSDNEGPVVLEPKGRNAGRRIIEKLQPKEVFNLIQSSSEYLAGQVQESGRFIYGWHPCFNREIKFYNTLRHASTTYSMIEAYELTQSEELRHAIEKSLSYLTSHFVKTATVKIKKEEVNAAFLVEHTKKEIKLGANGVLLLALCKYTEVFSDNKYLELLEQLAVGVAYMQDSATGKFVHILNYPELSVKDPFRIIYYDGEAAFGLMRLYGITKDPRWLAIVEKAFDYFIEAEHWKAHDHWLSYCVNELTLYKPAEKYYRFGLQNVAGYLDFIANRITTFPTLLELMMAAERMVGRLQASPEYVHLLEELDLDAFYEALEKRAHYLLNGYFWPEMAMFFARPERIVGSFFIRHHSFRVRIDDVEHYLSGFVAYWKYLEKKGVLSKKNLAHITNGKWVVEPSVDWKATGICTYKPLFKSGYILVARGKRKTGYLSDLAIKQLVQQNASAIICEDSSSYTNLGVPILQVSNVRAAVLSLGAAARIAFTGAVVGVTGSAGKTTTVAMMAHALSQFGTTAQTEESANVPVGIAWNQTNMPNSADSWVVEMAIGQMALNAELVKPQIALVTNIAPAHLIYHKSTEIIADKKSLILNEMNSDGVLVLYGEILHKEIFLNKAKEKGISVITYGEEVGNDVQLLEVGDDFVKVRFFEEISCFDIGIKNKHMILNALGVFSTLIASNLDWKNHLEVFKDFKNLAGRGEITSLNYKNKKITLYDESYNANPLSMESALKAFKKTKAESGSKFLILGDMMELGENEIEYHLNLKESILKTSPEKLILCGSLMKNLWEEIKESDDFKPIKKQWYPSYIEIIENIDSWIDDQDKIMLKASNSIGFEKVIGNIKSLSNLL